MDLLQLKYFYESSKNENFSHTALNHMVPPSAVSIAVKKLEKELGCELFIRQGNKIRLNEKGKLFSSKLKKMFEILDTSIDELNNTNGELTGDVYILARAERSILNSAVTDFLKVNPYVSFHISHNFDKEIAAVYNLIIDESNTIYPSYSSEPFVCEQLRFAASKNNPLCQKRVSLNQLANEKFITLSKSSSLSKRTYEICRQAGFEPKVAVECDDPHLLRQYVANGLGVTLVPEKSWKSEMDERIKFLDVGNLDVKRDSSIFIRQENTNKAVQIFKEFLCKAYRL